MRAWPVALPLDVKLHPRTEQDEAQRDRQDEVQRRNGPEQIGLLNVDRREGTEVEGALPHHQRHQDGEQQHAGTEQQTLSHGPVSNYRGYARGFGGRAAQTFEGLCWLWLHGWPALTHVLPLNPAKWAESPAFVAYASRFTISHRIWHRE